MTDGVAQGADAGAVRLLFCGDLVPSELLASRLATGDTDGLRRFRVMAAGADLVIANLEAPLTDAVQRSAKAGGAHLRGPVGLASWIGGLGIKAVTLANNHILDYGAPGLTDTLRSCQAAGIATLGAAMSAEDAARPLLLPTRHGTIGILAAAEREFNVCPTTGATANIYNVARTARQVRELRRTCDIAILVLHGNNEFAAQPRPMLHEEIDFLLEMGADMVVCHHAHCVAPLRVQGGKVVAYGLGNFIFPRSRPSHADWHVGALLEVTVSPERRIAAELVPFAQGLGDVLDFSSEAARAHVAGLPSVAEHQTTWQRRTAGEARTAIIELLWPFPAAHRLGRLGRHLAGALPTRLLLRLLNRLQCPSHLEAAVAALRHELAGRR